jgi:hypothetical protein
VEVLIALSLVSSYASDREESLPCDRELSVVTVLYSNVLSNSDDITLLSMLSVLLLATGSTGLSAAALCVTFSFSSEAPWKPERRSLAIRLPIGDAASRGSVSAALSYSVVSVSER